MRSDGKIVAGGHRSVRPNHDVLEFACAGKSRDPVARPQGEPALALLEGLALFTVGSGFETLLSRTKMRSMTAKPMARTRPAMRVRVPRSGDGDGEGGVGAEAGIAVRRPWHRAGTGGTRAALLLIGEATADLTLKPPSRYGSFRRWTGLAMTIDERPRASACALIRCHYAPPEVSRSVLHRHVEISHWRAPVRSAGIIAV